MSYTSFASSSWTFSQISTEHSIASGSSPRRISMSLSSTGPPKRLVCQRAPHPQCSFENLASTAVRPLLVRDFIGNPPQAHRAPRPAPLGPSLDSRESSAVVCVDTAVPSFSARDPSMVSYRRISPLPT